jgi:hypothetical protein
MPSPGEICELILKPDSSIRFVAIVNQMVRQVGTACCTDLDLELILTKEEIAALPIYNIYREGPLFG